MKGTWVVKHWAPVRLWEDHIVPLIRLELCPMKEERAFSLQSASGSEAVLTCRLHWVPFQFHDLFPSKTCGNKYKRVQQSPDYDS